MLPTQHGKPSVGLVYVVVPFQGLVYGFLRRPIGTLRRCPSQEPAARSSRYGPINLSAVIAGACNFQLQHITVSFPIRDFRHPTTYTCDPRWSLLERGENVRRRVDHNTERRQESEIHLPSTASRWGVYHRAARR